MKYWPVYIITIVLFLLTACNEDPIAEVPVKNEIKFNTGVVLTRGVIESDENHIPQQEMIGIQVILLIGTRLVILMLRFKLVLIKVEMSCGFKITGSLAIVGMVLLPNRFQSLQVNQLVKRLKLVLSKIQIPTKGYWLLTSLALPMVLVIESASKRNTSLIVKR